MPKLVSPVIAAGSLSVDPQPVLTSETGLLLRPWVVADAPMIIDAFRDPAIQHWHTRTIGSVSEAEDLIDTYAQGWRTESSAQWAVAAPDGEILGRVALCDIHLETGEAKSVTGCEPRPEDVAQPAPASGSSAPGRSRSDSTAYSCTIRPPTRRPAGSHAKPALSSKGPNAAPDCSPTAGMICTSTR